jgi:quercetin dioxygenase-like cupin family protein
MPFNAKLIQTPAVAQFDREPLTNVPLFEAEDFSGCVLGLLPGQTLPRHRHAHEHEAFDVLAGTGTIWLAGQPHTAGPGATVFVPAGVEHGFENTGSERWVIRATIHRRTYLRPALRRAILKRLGRAPR